MQNVEFKAELRDLPLARSIATASGAILAESLHQVDTYYRLADGRLKRRQIRPTGSPSTPEETQFIFYERANQASPRLSRFDIYSPAHAAERFGTKLPDPWVTVTKSRDVFLLDGVRIHLDQVEGLGSFIEFEAPIAPDRRIPTCFAAVDRLRELFRPAMGEPIDCSYSDLLAGR